MLELTIQGYRRTASQHIVALSVEYTLDRSPVHQRKHTIHSHTHSNSIRVSNQANAHVFGLWEEKRVPGQNSHKHGGNKNINLNKILPKSCRKG